MTTDLLSDRIAHYAATTPSKAAILYQDRVVTYAELIHNASCLAASLFALGVRPGDKVAILSHNRPEFLESWIAACQLGAALVPLNTRFGEIDLKRALELCDAKVFIFSARFRNQNYVDLLSKIFDGAPPVAGRKHPDFPELETLVAIDCDRSLGFLDYADLVRTDASAAPVIAGKHVTGETIGLLLFTSGTSNFPKPVMLTQGQIARNTDRIRARQEITAADRVLSFLPYFHVFGGVISTLVPLLSGGTIVMADAFDATETMELTQKHRCSVIYSVLPCWMAWLDHPNFGNYDLSSIRTGVCGSASPAGRATAMRVRELFGPMHSLFGMSETIGVATLSRKGDSDELAVTSSGCAVPSAEIGIFEYKTSNRLPAGEEGEVRVRGDMVTQGYYKMPGETAKGIDADGWLKTGDRGRLDENGYLYVLGRYTERLRCGAENIDPFEVEQFLSGHPSVGRCQVVGVPDLRLGEIPVAFVISRGPTPPDAEEMLKQYCRGKIGNFKIPRHIFFVDEFPGFIAKVHRHKLKEDAIGRVAALKAATTV